MDHECEHTRRARQATREGDRARLRDRLMTGEWYREAARCRAACEDEQGRPSQGPTQRDYKLAR
jgi:hypothetical protein